MTSRTYETDSTCVTLCIFTTMFLSSSAKHLFTSCYEDVASKWPWTCCLSLFFLPTKSEHITRYTKVGIMDSRNMQSGGPSNYQHSNQESRRWARARARTVRRSRKRDSDMRRLHTNWRFKKQQTCIIKKESHLWIRRGKIHEVKMHMYERKKISTWDRRVWGRTGEACSH